MIEGVQVIGPRVVLSISNLTSDAFLLVKEKKVPQGNYRSRHDQKAMKNYLRYIAYLWTLPTTIGIRTCTHSAECRVTNSLGLHAAL